MDKEGQTTSYSQPYEWDIILPATTTPLHSKVIGSDNSGLSMILLGHKIWSLMVMWFSLNQWYKKMQGELKTRNTTNILLSCGKQKGDRKRN